MALASKTLKATHLDLSRMPVIGWGRVAVEAWALTGQRNWIGAGGTLGGLPVEGSPLELLR